MKVRLLIVVFTFAFSAGFSQTPESFCITLSKVNTIIQENHYSPKSIDDSLSVYLFSDIIENLDDRRDIFLAGEIKSLRKHEFSIDDYILSGDCNFLTEFTFAYKKGLERNLEIIKELRLEKFPLNTIDTLFFTREQLQFYKERKDIKKLLKKRIVYDILEDIAGSSKNKDSILEHFKSLSQKSRAKVFDNFECRIQSKLNPVPNLEHHIFNVFLNSFCSYFDPHTNYFSIDLKSQFLNSVSSSNLTFGLEMEMDEVHQVSVYDIMAGSPAFKDGQIEKGDQLLKVTYGKAEFEVNCTNMDVIQNYISSDTYREVLLTFRKKNGDIYQSKLAKESFKNYENTCFSFLIQSEKNMLGYIYIPSFYSNLEGSSSNLSNDLAIELNHLKRQGVKGIIIDLQNNGGGSIYEAIKVSGSFIDVGPLAVVQNNLMEQNTLKDFNRGLLYDGPMVVLVNGYSASASELFAAILKDYNRALILGQQTFGKATMQSLFPLNDKEETDMVKVTIEKFFGITGDSHQKYGVLPDITTPALFSTLYGSEKKLPNALGKDSISVNTRFEKYSHFDYSPIIEKAQKRIRESGHYQQISSINKIIDIKFGQNKEVLLTFEGVYEDVTRDTEMFKEWSDFYENTFPMQIKILDKDLQKLEYDPFLQTLFTQRQKDIDTNPDVFEAIHLLDDLITK